MCRLAVHRRKNRFLGKIEWKLLKKMFVYIRETQYCLKILIVHSVLGFRQYMDPSWFGVI